MFLLPSITKVQLSTPEQSPEKVVPCDVNVTTLFKLKEELTTFELSLTTSVIRLTPPTDAFMPEGELVTYIYL